MFLAVILAIMKEPTPKTVHWANAAIKIMVGTVSLPRTIHRRGGGMKPQLFFSCYVLRSSLSMLPLGMKHLHLLSTPMYFFD